MEQNKVYNIDCIEGIKQISDKSVKLICTDPPYFLGMTHNGKKGRFVDLAICRPFYEILFKEYRRVLADDGCLFWFCDFRSYPFYYQCIEPYFDVTNLIVWDKMGGPGNKLGFWHEFIVFCTLDKAFNKGGSNVWQIEGFGNPKARKRETQEFASQKPNTIISKIIRDFSKEGDLVLDTFTGSGSTAVACKQLNRNFIGFELDCQNFSLIEKRLARGSQELLFIDV